MEDFAERFPVFHHHFSQLKLNRYVFTFVYHLNTNNAPFLEYWVRQTNTLAVISIPYSEIVEVKKRLKRLIRVFSPQNFNEISRYIKKINDAHTKKNIILVEIGGYSSTISQKLHNVILAVEDTNYGHWAHIKKGGRNFPVVSMAQAQVKMLENRLIGESIIRTVENIINEVLSNERLANKTIAVIGYGGIGSSVCLALRRRNIIPYVYDIDPYKAALAHADSYKIAPRQGVLQIADIVLGCTGKHSVMVKDGHLIKKGAFLFSGSSKKVEFSSLLQLEKEPTRHSVIEKYKFEQNYFYIAYNGQPINFLDTLQPELFDIQFAALTQCVKYGLEKKLSNAVHPLPYTYQTSILNSYIQNNYSKR
ncbi:hypothetical protein HYT33_01860 [Candidatus Roizmanbacteria bacterium]|nr:hypothetical protein [Candidatus Roizmanbacteria bacterium]